MKKFVLFIIVLICICLNFPKFSYYKIYNNASEDVLFYTTSKEIQNENIECRPLLNIHNQKMFEAKINKKDLKNYCEKYEVQGFTFKLKKEKNIDVYKLLNSCNVKILDKQKIENKILIYGYSSFLDGYTLADNKKINLQVVINDQEIIIGSPLIIGSY